MTELRNKFTLKPMYNQWQDISTLNNFKLLRKKKGHEKYQRNIQSNNFINNKDI